jgi:hypothetical protein
MFGISVALSTDLVLLASRQIVLASSSYTSTAPWEPSSRAIHVVDASPNIFRVEFDVSVANELIDASPTTTDNALQQA